MKLSAMFLGAAGAFASLLLPPRVELTPFACIATALALGVIAFALEAFGQ